MEYKIFAKYYDKFYKNKKYNNEVMFLEKIITSNRKSILDIGCGTGIHASLLESLGYKVDLVDISIDMLDIARTRTSGVIYNQDVLNLKLDKKYDAIISMFAVMNHLKNTEQLKQAIINMKNLLNDDGIIIIDLHNPKASGEKEDVVEDMKRVMKWEYNKKTRIEISEIIFEIDGNSYKDSHIFKIFTIKDVEDICMNLDLKLLNVFENYTLNEANQESKNLQFIITKK